MVPHLGSQTVLMVSSPPTMNNNHSIISVYQKMYVSVSECTIEDELFNLYSTLWYTYIYTQFVCVFNECLCV